MNKQRGYFPIDFEVVQRSENGEPLRDENGDIKTKQERRYIRYTFNSMAILEDELGIKVTKINPDKMGATDMLTFVWAGLIHEDKNLTKEEVGEMISGMGAEVFSKASEALAYCMGGDRAVNEAKKRRRAWEAQERAKANGGRGRKSSK